MNRIASRVNGRSPSAGAAATRLVATGLFQGTVYQPVALPADVKRFVQTASADELQTLLAEAACRLESLRRGPMAATQHG